MRKRYFENPILGAYLHILPRIESNEEVDKYLDSIRKANATGVWAFVGNVESDRLKYFLDRAEELGLKVIPVFQPNISVVEHPEVKIVCADGSTSDDPRYANIGCFNHPYLMDVSKKMIKEFLEAFKDHSSLYRIDGLPLLSFIHEAYYRTDIPEFGGSPLKPCCYCGYCVEDFRKKMKEKYGDVEEFNERHGTDFSSWEDLEPPRSDVNPSLWKEWLDYHSDIIPNFLEELIEYAKSITPVLSTHELNDFYPCTYQCVYSGNDIWRMARVIDIGHEDMYPLEFDHRYVIYVYEYIKDAVRTAMGFEKIYTGNGQSFNSWLGYKIPPASMSEQVYSTLAHGALGLVWWVDWGDLGLWAQTAKPNAEFARLISALKDYELTRAEVALVYPWTTMQLRTDDAYSMDNLLFYMALVRSGYPVDVISEDQILGGLLEERGYKILCTVGSSVFPPDVAEKIREFVRKGGVLIADYEKGGIGEFTPVYPELMGKSPTKHVIYEIDTDDPSLRAMNGTTIPIGNLCEQLRTPETGKTVARFENGEPAVIMVQEGSGRIIKAGSFLGWDYSNYPGHYDFAVMFPFLIRRNEDVREMISRIIKGSGVQPPAESENPDVEVAFWRSRGRSLVLAINHLNEPSETAIQVRVDTSSSHRVREFFTGEEISSGTRGNRLIFRSSHSNFEGKAYIIEET